MLIKLTSMKDTYIVTMSVDSVVSVLLFFKKRLRHMLHPVKIGFE